MQSIVFMYSCTFIFVDVCVCLCIEGSWVLPLLALLTKFSNKLVRASYIYILNYKSLNFYIQKITMKNNTNVNIIINNLNKI